MTLSGQLVNKRIDEGLPREIYKESVKSNSGSKFDEVGGVGEAALSATHRATILLRLTQPDSNLNLRSGPSLESPGKEQRRGDLDRLLTINRDTGTIFALSGTALSKVTYHFTANSHTTILAQVAKREQGAVFSPLSGRGHANP